MLAILGILTHSKICTTGQLNGAKLVPSHSDPSSSLAIIPPGHKRNRRKSQSSTENKLFVKSGAWGSSVFKEFSRNWVEQSKSTPFILLYTPWDLVQKKRCSLLWLGYREEMPFTKPLIVFWRKATFSSWHLAFLPNLNVRLRAPDVAEHLFTGIRWCITWWWLQHRLSKHQWVRRSYSTTWRLEFRNPLGPNV